MNKATELEMLNNRIYGRSFGKGNNDDVGVKWNTVLKLIEEAKIVVLRETITHFEHTTYETIEGYGMLKKKVILGYLKNKLGNTKNTEGKNKVKHITNKQRTIYEQTKNCFNNQCLDYKENKCYGDEPENCDRRIVNTQSLQKS